MQTVPAELFVQTLPTPIVPFVQLELPDELDEALRMSALHDVFARLSSLQRTAYAEWIDDGPTADVRWERASLVCRVIRRMD